MAEGIRIAIVGAESTGKTTLARALAERIAVRTGLASTWVGEVLREWCDREGRTPRRDEQASIAREQQRRIDASAASHRVVVCDTTALMTAVYSRLIFDDGSLEAWAIEAHRASAITLLTALDLPWTADGLQRDGPQVRSPVDALVRGTLATYGLRWALVAGQGEARVASAFDAVATALGWPLALRAIEARPTTAAPRGPA